MSIKEDEGLEIESVKRKERYGERYLTEARIARMLQSANRKTCVPWRGGRGGAGEFKEHLLSLGESTGRNTVSVENASHRD